MVKSRSLLIGFSLLIVTLGADAATKGPVRTSIIPLPAQAQTSKPNMLPPGGGSGGGGGGSTSTATMTYFNRDVPSKGIEVDLSNRIIEYVNVPANTVTLQTPNGTQTTFTIDQVMLQAANGNVTVAAANKATLIAELQPAINTARFKQITAGPNATVPLSVAASRNFTLGSNAVPKLGPTVLSHSTGLAVTTPKKPGPTLIMMPPDGGGDSFDCDPDFDCAVDDIVWGGDGGSDDFYYMDVDAGGGPGTSDYNYFLVWQHDHCSSASSDRTASLELTGTFVLACGTAETGIGVIGCAAAGISLITTLNRTADDTRDCLMQYPGPGNWG